MKVLLVADARSIHTRRWVEALSSEGVDIVLFTLYPPGDSYFDRNGFKYHVYDLFTYSKTNPLSKAAGILRHLHAVRYLKKIIRKENPDILHAHYATSFGLVASLTGFHPFLLSVWGSDVYIYPEQSALNRKIVEYSLNKADKVLSTSRIMAKRTSLFFKGTCEITPFGVDCSLFRKIIQPLGFHHPFTVGTVKSLKPVYGIDRLIRAFALFKENFNVPEARLVIAGDGEQRDFLRNLSEELHIADSVRFIGNMDNSSLPAVYSSFDVACFLSSSESFGVSAVEAMACECPVVVSGADGFREVVEDGKTGIMIEGNSVKEAASAIGRLYSNPSLREVMGKNGRKRVMQYYHWKDNVAAMISIYDSVLEHNGGKS